MICVVSLQNLWFVSISVPPLISSNSAEDNVLTISRSLRLDCDAAGDPVPDIHWLKDGEQLTEADYETIRVLREGRFVRFILISCNRKPLIRG